MTELRLNESSSNTQPLQWRFWLPLVLATLLTIPLIVTAARSDENADSKTDPDQAKKERAARLETMRLHAASLKVSVQTGGEFAETELIDIPLLHYNNPAGVTLDATVWAWGRHGRPVALTSISQEKSDSKIEKWSCELVSLADEPITLTGKPGWKWAPAASGIAWKPVTDAMVPGTTQVIRARQMKEIALRYSVTGTYRAGAETTELRLMDRPLSRFSDPEHGLIDGAFYAFAAGTNPEVLLIVECREKTGGGRSWYYGFARMGAGRVVARLGKTIVWEQPEIKSWDPSEPYFSTFGSVESVFGNNTTDSKR